MVGIIRSHHMKYAGLFLAAATLFVMGAATAGAAERVVLGEYFTSVF